MATFSFEKTPFSFDIKKMIIASERTQLGIREPLLIDQYRKKYGISKKTICLKISENNLKVIKDSIETRLKNKMFMNVDENDIKYRMLYFFDNDGNVVYLHNLLYGEDCKTIAFLDNDPLNYFEKNINKNDISDEKIEKKIAESAKSKVEDTVIKVRNNQDNFKTENGEQIEMKLLEKYPDLEIIKYAGELDSKLDHQKDFNLVWKIKWKNHKKYSMMMHIDKSNFVNLDIASMTKVMIYPNQINIQAVPKWEIDKNGDIYCVNVLNNNNKLLLKDRLMDNYKEWFNITFCDGQKSNMRMTNLKPINNEKYYHDNNLKIIKEFEGFFNQRKVKTNDFRLLKDIDKNEEFYEIDTNNGKSFFVDKDSLNKIKTVEIDDITFDASWYQQKATGYFVCTVPIKYHRELGEHLSLHGYLANFFNRGKGKSNINKFGKSVDHINRKKFDNRTSNLKIKTQSEQNTNMDKKKRKENAKPFPRDLNLDLFGLDNVPIFVEFSSEPRKNNSKIKEPIEYFKISSNHPKLKSDWKSTKEHSISSNEKLRQVLEKLESLENEELLSQCEKNKFPNRVQRMGKKDLMGFTYQHYLIEVIKEYDLQKIKNEKGKIVTVTQDEIEENCEEYGSDEENIGEQNNNLSNDDKNINIKIRDKTRKFTLRRGLTVRENYNIFKEIIQKEFNYNLPDLHPEGEFDEIRR